MNLRWCLMLPILFGLSGHEAFAEPPNQKQQTTLKKQTARVSVQEQVGALVRPMLDLRKQSMEQCGKPGDPSKCLQGTQYEDEQQRQQKFAELLTQLTLRKDTVADEALVVLMCFYVGESQEERDAVIVRGNRMLPYLTKYRRGRPSIRRRMYPNSMYKSSSRRAEDLSGTIKAIKQKWHNSAENPEG
jgi:hypothetical protein